MTSETCANCGLLEKFHPVWSLTGTERVLCKKFKHQKGKFVSLYQNNSPQLAGDTSNDSLGPNRRVGVEVPSGDTNNHSPQGHKVGSATGNPAKFKDTESEEIKTETQVVNDRLNSSGLDNQIPHKHPRIDGSDNASSLSDKINEMLDGDIVIRVEDVKESVQKLKDEMNKWKKIIGKTRDEMEIGYKDALTNVEDEIDKIFGSALI